MNEKEVLLEKETRLHEYVRQLQEMLAKKQIDVELDDTFLIKFLRAKLFDVDETVALIENYFSMFKKYPEFFENVRFAEKAIKDGFFELIPERNSTGEKIGIVRLGAWVPGETSFASAVASTAYGYEMALMDEETQINGFIEILDCEKASVLQLISIGLKEMKLICDITDGSFPLRLRKFFVVRQNFIADLLYAMGKPFLSKEFKEAARFIGHDFTELHEMVSPDILPPEYGGKAEPREYTAFYAKLLDFEPKLMAYWKPFKNR